MASLSGLQKRYKRALADEDFYAAEQACRMMHHRLTQAKSPTSEDLDRAREILRDSATTLLQKGQVQAGTALSLLLVKHLTDHRVPVRDAAIAQLRDLAAAFGDVPPAETADNAAREHVREKLRFLKAAVAWSANADCAGFEAGHAALNTLAARAAGDAGDFELAQRLFVRSDDPQAFAAYLHEYTETQTLASEKALVLTRAICKYLLSENIKDAVALRLAFVKLAGWKSVDSAGEGEGAQKAPPLGNFCELLLKICQLERAAAELYTKVLGVYDAELRRDESIPPMLTTIGTIYFGIQPPQQGGLGMMMNSMLRGMMNG